MKKPKISRLSLFFWLLLVSYGALVPRLWKIGTNIVTHTYHEGAERFVHHQDLYAMPMQKGDRFLYSPLFAMLYSPFLGMSDRAEALVWAFLNCALFWIGVTCWLPRSPERSWITLAALLITSAELNISVLYQQINAALIGLILIAARMYYARWRFSAGFLFAWLANIKFFPIVLLGALATRGGPEYLWGAVLGGVVSVTLPALVSGFTYNFFSHQQWISRLFSTFGEPSRYNLDLAHVLPQFGMASVATFIHWSVFAITGLSAFLFPLLQNETRARLFKHWLIFLLMGILLVSPMTESPTFILIAPAYVFLAELIERAERRGRSFGVLLEVLFVGIAFFLTISYTDLWSKTWWNPSYPYKSMALLTMWFIYALYFTGEAIRNFTVRPAVKTLFPVNV